MNRTDWDAYLDGSMSAADRESLDSRLAQEPALARELVGFKAFKAAVHGAGTAVSVPVERLDQALTAASRPVPGAGKPAIRWAVRLAPVAAVVVALAAVYWPQPIQRQPSDPVAIGGTAFAAIDVKDPVQAAKWIFEQTGIPVPALTLGRLGNLSHARHGKTWARLDYGVEGHTVHLYVSMSDTFEGAATTDIQGYRFYRGAHGFGWRENGLSYYANGCEDEFLIKAVVAVRTELDAIPDRSPSQGKRARVQ